MNINVDDDERTLKKIRKKKRKSNKKYNIFLFYIIMIFIIIILFIYFFSYLIFKSIFIGGKQNNNIINNYSQILNITNGYNNEIRKETSINNITTIINMKDMLINKSYAQCLEDLILNIFFYDINKGFYIDIGANNPNILSVTKYFYLKGWNGINIEPLKLEYENLKSERTRDINIQACAGEKDGNITIYENGSLTTTRKEYYHGNKTGIIVRLQTMSNICKEYIPKKKIINFCKIDVEGDEREVLLGFDFENYRPNAFCIEYTKPGTLLINYNRFEDILLKNNYEFIFSYGINRYYIDKNLPYLKERAKYIEKVIITFKTRNNKKYLKS